MKHVFDVLLPLGDACFPIHRLSITAGNFVERSKFSIAKAFSNMEGNNNGSNNGNSSSNSSNSKTRTSVFKSSPFLSSGGESRKKKKGALDMFATNDSNKSSNKFSSSAAAGRKRTANSSNKSGNEGNIEGGLEFFRAPKKTKTKTETVVNDDAFQHLAEMGFAVGNIIKALKDHDNNIELALNQLM